jgi:hypothetical protein
MQQIATALVKAQKEFSPALKCSTNPHFKSRYADLAACLEAVQDPLNNNGIALLQVTHDDSNGVTVETLFIHESGEQISGGKLHVPASKQDPQGYGSALTYARRYSLLAACGIAPEDDDGNAATKSAKPAPKPKLKPVTDEDIETFTFFNFQSLPQLKNAYDRLVDRATENNQDDFKTKIVAIKDEHKKQLSEAKE